MWVCKPLTTMIIIPLPPSMTDRAVGETFDVTATVTLTEQGLQVTAVEGEPVAEATETEDVELDQGAINAAFGQ